MIQKMKKLREMAMRGLKYSVAVTAILAGMATSAYSQNAQAYEIDIEPQALSTALRDFSDQTQVQVIYAQELIDGKAAAGVEGELTPTRALDAILSDTGLAAKTIDDTTIAIVTLAELEGTEAASLGEGSTEARPFRVATLAQEDDVREVEVRVDEGDGEARQDVIVVTGTSIRGVAPDSAPVDVYTDSDIAKSGATTIEQFIAKLPQSLNSNTSIAISATGRTDGGFGRNGIDLRGLGIGTTLVLLNGRRLVAPGGRSADISLIPLGAIERIEVLTDGASAIYGSDAVGGVVNIILKEDVEGVDLGFSYGTVTSGDHDQLKLDLTVGTKWSSGSVSGSYNFFDQSPLRASDRDFSLASSPYFLMPEDVRHSGVVSFEQEIGPKLTLDADAVYSERDVQGVSTTIVRNETVVTESSQEQYFLNAGLTYAFSENYSLEVSGTYSDFTQNQSTQIFLVSDGSLDREGSRSESGTDLELATKIDGALLELPAGQLRFAVGAGYGEETFELTTETLERERSFIFGEVFVPIIGPDQNIPGIHRLELNGALRWTDYSDFDANTSPRFGLLWSPIDGINLRGTYTEAFRAPALFQLSESGGLNTGYFLVSPALFGFPDPFSPTDSSVYLFAQGSNNPNIGPETSQSYTAGFDIDRTGIEGLSISATYFNIDYVDRVAEPDSTGGFAALADPGSFPSLFNDNPSPEFIAELTNNATSEVFLDTVGVDTTDLAAIIAATTVTLDNRIQNVASSKVEGLDFGFDYETETQLGTLSLGGNLTYMLESTISPVEGAPIVDELNRPIQPVDLRFRTFAGITKNGFTSQLNVNYVDSYSDPFQSPEVPIDSWTTVDLSLSYAFASKNSIFTDGLQLSLNVTNLFDEDPPFLGVSNLTNVALNQPVGFDPANANPVGRFIEFGIRKQF